MATGITELRFLHEFVGGHDSAGTPGILHIDSLEVMSGGSDVANTGTITELLVNNVSVTSGYSGVASLLSSTVRYQHTVTSHGSLEWVWRSPTPIDIDSVTLASSANNASAITVCLVASGSTQPGLLMKSRWWGHPNALVCAVDTGSAASNASTFPMDYVADLSDTSEVLHLAMGGAWDWMMDDPMVKGISNLCLRVTDPNGVPVDGTVTVVQKEPNLIYPGRRPVYSRQVRAGRFARIGALPGGVYSVMAMPDDVTLGAPAAYDVTASPPVG